MKNLGLIAICIIAFTFSGCKKKFTHFYVDYETETVIPATFSTFLPFSLNTPEMVTNSTYEFENHDTKKKHIESIFLKNLKLTITNPNGETFSFVNSIKLYISSPDVSEKLVATADSIPDNIGNELILDVIDVDLQEYIKADKFKLRLNVTSDETIPQDVNVDIYSNFLVDAKLIRFKK